MLRRAAKRAVEGARVAAPRLRSVEQARRRRAFVMRTRLAATWAHATIDLDIADDVRIGAGVRVTFEPWSHNVLHVGAASSLDDRVLIQLKGGQVHIGERVELRRDVLLNVAGRLELQGDNPVSWNTVIHCSNEVTVAPMAGIAEHVTIADSSHFFTTPDEHFWHNVRVGTVTVGRNTWICPKVTLARGAQVGDYCIVGSNSVVVDVVPDGSMASGVPATVRPLALPWADAVKAMRGSAASGG
jgi:acetyltransferase-like isoleucine patch superfamily enzyme